LVGQLPPFARVGAHPEQPGDVRRCPSNAERVQVQERSIARRTHPHRVTLDERLTPEVAALECNARPAQSGGHPAPRRGEWVDHPADHNVRPSPPGSADEEGHHEGQLVGTAAPVAAAMGDRPRPDDPNAVAVLDIAEAPEAKPLLVADSRAESTAMIFAR